MKQIFVDANAWIALSSKRDRLHDSAIALHRELLEAGYRYITTNFVLDETYTILLMHIGHYAAVDFGERVRSSSVIDVIHVTEGIEQDAWSLFKQYSDKQFSFTDCTSFVVMRRLNLIEAFTNDHHFEQAGFSARLR
ncbi:MAG: PIN domain-containing protein [Chloroflexi bacterium]|nr:PIN domain-containing protein [Chloroflexota bacterium]MCL5274998.1 PIN domain-containing protein [Chloroflexota bacterium]